MAGADGSLHPTGATREGAPLCVGGFRVDTGDVQTVRPPAVAGAFYPGQPSMLARQVTSLLEEARANLRPDTQVPKALLLPHAGYVYSGSTAALGYAALAPAAATLRRVVLLGPTHRVAVDGLALPGVEAFDTPLGRVLVGDVDPTVRARLPQLVESRGAHAMEHSLEVQLPFLQQVLGDFQLLPLAVGRRYPCRGGRGAGRGLGRPGDADRDQLRSVAFPATTRPRRMDARPSPCWRWSRNSATTRPAAPRRSTGCCWRRAGMACAPAALDVRNSGDTAGDRRGWSAMPPSHSPRPRHEHAWAVEAPERSSCPRQGRDPAEARRVEIGRKLGPGLAWLAQADWLNEPGASFVTLTTAGRVARLHRHPGGASPAGARMCGKTRVAAAFPRSALHAADPRGI